MSHTENVLVNRMSLERKRHALETYLKTNEGGHTVTVDGVTYAWFDQLITDERTGADGQTEYFGIEGLAHVMQRLTADGTEPYYMGTGSPAQQEVLLAHLATQLNEEQLFDMTAANALYGMRKQRIHQT